MPDGFGSSMATAVDSAREIVKPPSRDFDGMSDRDILDMGERLYQAWDARDKEIQDARRMFRHDWTVAVPEGWDQTAKTQHTSKAKEIPIRIINTVTLRDPQFSRVTPADEFGAGIRASSVEHFFQGYFSYNRREGIKGRDAYKFQAGQFVHKGASCIGSLFAPNAWAGADLFLDDDGEPHQAYWRDSSGKRTTDKKALDYEAAGRAYMSAVDTHRKTAKPPIKRRYVPTDQCYPLLVDGEMVALFIRRQATTLELAQSGFYVDTGGNQLNPYSTDVLLEVITPNRCRYYKGNQPVSHMGSGSDGVYTGYGFIPYSYRAAIDGADLDYASFGFPLLSLVKSNIETITTLKTYLNNAIHMASFTSFYIKYTDKDGNSVGALRDNKSQKDIATFQFRTGTIMDFGPGREVTPLTHPGLNSDFWKLVAQEEQELDRMFPRSLSGQAESSGYNTVQSTLQAKTIIDPIYDGISMQEEELAIMDMHHITDRVPGPIYLEYAQRQSMGSSRPASMNRIKLSGSDIGSYYQIHVSADKEMDRVTLGTWAAAQVERGIGDIEWAADLSGIEDYEGMVQRQARDRVFKSDLMMQTLEQDAVNQFGLRRQAEAAAAAARIQTGPDGTPMVIQPNGSLAGPGQAAQTPEAQGPVGAMLGGANASALPGMPNMNSTSANPQLTQPAPTPTGRTASGGGRNRRRGGAIPGAPQRPQTFPPPQMPV